MKPLGKMMHHLRLVSRMARATETDLVAAYQGGELSHEEWAEMVQNCRRCDWADSCDSWLARHDVSTEGPVEAPETCRNCARFRALAPHETEVA